MNWLCSALLLVATTHDSGIVPCLSLDSCSITGVSPNECGKYEAKERVFYCGGKENRRIPMKYVNDDYCDCAETGADEPGTSACINGYFYCNNLGFRGKKIFSSWVNDGICDCCDGSDEWEMQQKGKVQCSNTCSSLAEEELKEVRAQKRKFQQVQLILFLFSTYFFLFCLDWIVLFAILSYAFVLLFFL